MSEAQKREGGHVPEHGLSRAVWTEQDFAVLGWHDATVRAIDLRLGERAESELGRSWPQDRLAFDIDYITRWVGGPTPGAPFDFWVAPATLVFHGITELVLEIETAYSGGFEIADIHLVRDGWFIDGYHFEVKLVATGFTQTFRRRPIFTGDQRLTLAERGGYSYDETPAPL